MSNNKTIIFRANSSSTIGTGHIMRDLVLANSYARDGYGIVFATQELDGNINHKIIESTFKIEILKDNSIEEFQKTIDKYNPNLIVIDSYDIDYEFEKRLKDNNKNVKLLCFDDTYERHYCDIILNHNISADESKYKGLVPQNCELRCGAKYTLLRDEFIIQKKMKTIFLAMGGADHSNINIDILEVLKEFDNIEVNLVTTTANQNLEALKEYVKDKEWIELYINSNQIAKLMRLSDFAVVTPSVTINEVCFMDMPFVAIKTAENQNDMYEYLLNNNYMILENFDKNQLSNSLDKLFKPKLINFINLSYEDKLMVLEWRNNKDIRKWMFNKDIISIDDHLSYIESLEDKTDRVYFLVKDNNSSIGVIDLTSIANNSANIGLYANPNIRGVGKILMNEIIKYAFNILKLHTIFSEVFIENTNAIKLYEKFGFVKKNRDNNIIIMELQNENR